MKDKKLAVFKLSTLTLPLLLVLIIEATQRYGIIETFTWIIHYPGYFVLSLLFVYSLYIVVSLLTRHLIVPFLLIFMPIFIIGVINGIKIQYREVPVLPWNAIILKEIGSIFKLIGDIAILFIFGIILIASIIIATVISYKRFTVRMPGSIRFSGLAVAFTIMLITGYICAQASYSSNLLETYMERGLVPASIVQFTRPMMEKPEKRYDGRIADLFSKNPAKEEEQGRSADAAVESDNKSDGILGDKSDITLGNISVNMSDNMPDNKSDNIPDNKPDIIVVMLEAFSDPNQMKNIKFSSDPVPNYNKIKKNAVSGFLSVNAYGGNTSCTEFEFLTGLSSALLAPEITGYMDVLKKPVPNIVQNLSSSGYNCIAMHPFYPETLGRKGAYKMLGFDEFIDINSFSDEEIKGKYTSDEALGNRIIKLYEKNLTENDAELLFLFTITIQNHYDYKPVWYGANPDIDIILPDNISSKAGAMLNGYIQGVHDSDKLIGKLTDYFSNASKPVVLVFFGDHLPGMSGGAETYANAGLIGDYKRNIMSNNKMITGISQDDLTKMHTTPFIIWDNFKKTDKQYGTVSPCYLPAILSDIYGLPDSNYVSLLSELLIKVPDLGLAAWPNHYNFTAQQKNALEEFKTVQYEILYGQNE